MNKRILLLGNIKEDGCISMHVYLKDLLKNFKRKMDYIEPSSGAVRSSIYKVFIYPFLIKRKYDIYHIVDHSYGNLAYLLPGSKTIVTCHDLIPLKFKNRTSTLNRLSFRFYVNGLKKARKILSISENTKEDLKKILNIPKERIKVIPYGIDLSIFKGGNKENAKKKLNLDGKIVLLSTGSNFYKNSSLIIKQLANIKKRYSNLVWVKIGRLSQEEKNLIEKEKIGDIIINKKKVPQKELNEYYNASDILIFPSIYEGFGRPPLEAMACGLPVITSNTSSLPEVVGDAAIKIDPNSGVNLRSAIIEIIENKKTRDDLIKRGFENIKRFSWDRHIEEIEKIYDDI